MKCEFARSKVSHSHFWSVLLEQFSKLLQIMFFSKLHGRVAWSLKCHVLIVLLLSVTVRGRMLNSKYVGVWRAAKCKNTFTTMSKFINFNATREITDLCCWIRI